MLYLVAAVIAITLGLISDPLTDRHSCKGHCDPFTTEPGGGTIIPPAIPSGGGIGIPPGVGDSE